MAKCSELKPGDQVVYVLREDGREIYGDGTVALVTPGTVHTHRLEGYRDRADSVPFNDMRAKYDPDGQEMRFGNIHGPSVLLEPC